MHFKICSCSTGRVLDAVCILEAVVIVCLYTHALESVPGSSIASATLFCFHSLLESLWHYCSSYARCVSRWKARHSMTKNLFEEKFLLPLLFEIGEWYEFSVQLASSRVLSWHIWFYFHHSPVQVGESFSFFSIEAPWGALWIKNHGTVVIYQLVVWCSSWTGLVQTCNKALFYIFRMFRLIITSVLSGGTMGGNFDTDREKVGTLDLPFCFIFVTQFFLI